MMNKEKAFGLLNELNADAILLLNEANMHYMCGFSPSEGMVFITKDGGAYHIVDSRYIETAQENAKETGLTAIEPDTDFYTELKKLADKHSITSLVIENETISLLQYQKVFAKLGGVKLIDLNDRLMRIRNRKEPEEIIYMKKANAIAEAAFTELLNHVEAGKTEKELASYFDYLMAKNGSYGLSFDTILLTGAHTSMPHGVPSDKVINKGDFVLFDFGATYKGYHSDMTRTVAVGSATEEMKNCYSLVLEAQTAGIKALNAGVKCADVYKAAYD
ncbi:MAG: aminopeptidase P family protein, partial [Eubacterium sp.]|nr:aminopeptidase P family protein [Eubacterium sp.]